MIEIWRDIVRPANDKDRAKVRTVQLILRCPQTGEMDPDTVGHIRGAQVLFGIKPTGIIDKHTYDTIRTLRWTEDAIQE